MNSNKCIKKNLNMYLYICELFTYNKLYARHVKVKHIL